MNPELTQIAARCRYQDLLRAAQHEHRVESTRVRRTSGLGRAMVSMRFGRRRRALAIRTAAVA